MTEEYKRLGAIAPADKKEKLLYTSPENTQSLISNITVTNRSSSAQTFDVNVYESGVTQQGALDDVFGSFGFVAFATQTSELATSTDGITWTARTNAGGDGQARAVAHGDGVFVAISGATGQFFRDSSNSAAYSTDGITWTNNSLPSTEGWRSVAYGNNTFVAVAGSGYYGGFNNAPDFCATGTYSDGITWTIRTMPSFQFWRSVSYGNDIFVVTADRYYAAAASSTDGITWTARTLPSVQRWQSSIYGDDIFVIVASQNAAAASSTDGITWTARTMPSSAPWLDVAYGNNTFVAVAGYDRTSRFGCDSAAAATSTDGITWTARTLPSINSWAVAAYGEGVFVAIASYITAAAATSTDGITWTARTMPSSAPWSCVTGSDSTVSYTSPIQTTLYKTSQVAANSTELLEPGIALGPEGAVVVKDNSGGNLTFSAYGVELS